MRKQVATTLAVLALGWTAGSAVAGEPALPGMAGPTFRSQPTMVVPPAGDPAPTGMMSGGAPAWAADRGPFLSVPGGDPINWGSPEELLGGHVYAGGGVYLIHPNFTSNPAFSVIRTNGVPSMQRPATQRFEQDFRYDLEPAPLGWLGYVSQSGLGFRARWWQYDESAGTRFVNDGNSTVSSAVPLGIGIDNGRAAAGDVLRFGSDLKVTVWDFEGTQSLRAGCWDLLFAAGARYVWMAQDYAASAVSAGGVDRVNLASRHTFNGVGPTVAAEGRFRIGESGLALYGSGRASAPFGRGRQEAIRTTPTIFEAENARNSYTLLPITELELGAEYGADFGPVHLFMQAGFVGQAWFGGGNAANVESSFTGGSDGNFGFIGMVFRTGVTY